MNNKWIRAAIPALLIHCSIGTVYCWSLFSEAIATEIGSSKSNVEWAFSIAIFCLGMSAAFLGKIVEKNIHRSSLIATICFTVGMAGTGFFISQKSLLGIYLCYGVIMGIGLGTGYLSPVKTLMLWFKETKGLATGLAVAGFGIAKAIASPIMEWMQQSESIGLVKMFYILAAVYFVMMFTGHLLLKKPDGWVESHSKSDVKITSVMKTKTFIGIWLMFFLNITCGLAIISQEKAIVKSIGLGASVATIAIISALFNATGRLGYSTAADKLKDRNTIYKLIFCISIVLCTASVITQGIVNSIVPLTLALIFMINAGYGGGFSNLPTLLSDHFGMKTISAVHGIALSAWAMAGLAGNQLSAFIVTHFGEAKEIIVDGHEVEVYPTGYQYVLYVVLALYIVALLISFFVVGKPKTAEEKALLEH